MRFQTSDNSVLKEPSTHAFAGQGTIQPDEDGAARVRDSSENVRRECIGILAESGKIYNLRNVGVRGKTTQRIRTYWLLQISVLFKN